MSTKTSTAQQPPGRRTPLSLNTATKQINRSTNDKNDNSKKETNTNNQKTEVSKKDTQPERKPSVDKKPSTVEARKPSASESKKPEDAKPIRNEENKKNQNGVSSNGVKDKEKQTEGPVKAKPETSNGSSTPRKESQKAPEKKKESAAAEVVAVIPKEAKNDDNKNKTEEKKKESTNDTSAKKVDEKKKEKEKKEDVKEFVENKKPNEKSSEEKPQHAKVGDKKATEPLVTIDLDSSSEKTNESPVKEKKNEEIKAPKTPLKEKVTDGSPKVEEKEVQPPLEELEDVEMEPLVFEAQPSSQICASSTPAKPCNRMEISSRREEPVKTSPKSEVKSSRAPLSNTPDRKSCPRTFSSISGRRSIRPIGDYSIGGNLHFRESYRKINTELDFTNSSLNVTVGSEVPNNDSFSFFSRSRKRERSSPSHQSTMEVHADISPKSPKRARIDLGMNGFFSAMASPITMLRARLARSTVRSTPKKQVEVPAEEDIVENVSGISVDEDITATEDLTVNPDSNVDNHATDDDPPKGEDITAACSQKPPVIEGVNYEDDIKIKETIRTTDTQPKKKCSIM